MKKLLAIVLSVAMLACMVVVASAAETATVTIGTVEGKAGQEVTVPVTLGAVQNGWARLDISNVTYDETALEFAGYTAGTAGGMGMDNGTTYGWICVTAVKEGVVVNMTFKVLKDLDAPVAISAEMAGATYTDGNIVANEDATINVVAGAVTPPVVVPSDPTDVKPPVTSVVEPRTDVEPSKEAPVDNKTENPKSGDASAVAVAGVLCAAMAAAFVLTKKVK